MSNAYAAYIAFKNGGLSDVVYAVAANSIKNKILDLKNEWVSENFNEQLYLEDVRKIRKLYETALSNGERVFAISHSQGGLFMKDAFMGITNPNKKKYFSGFQVASPLPYVMDSHFGYATHDKDLIIESLVSKIKALPSNIVAPETINNARTGHLVDDGIEFIVNHGMVTTYLYDSTIKSKVISKLITTAQLLESNCSSAVINYTKNNLQVNFDSTDLENPNEEGLTYSWNFGDGQVANVVSKKILHNYSVPGNYTVSLTVTDISGTTSTTQITLTVQDNVVNTTFCGHSNGTTLTFEIEGFDTFELAPTAVIGESLLRIECIVLPVQMNKKYNMRITSTKLARPLDGLIVPVLPFNGVFELTSAIENGGVFYFLIGNYAYTPQANESTEFYIMNSKFIFNDLNYEYVYKNNVSFPPLN